MRHQQINGALSYKEVLSCNLLTPNQEEEDKFEDEVCIIENERQNVDITYKRKAVEYWTSGKKQRLSLSVVQHRFRKVKSLTQLYRWQESINSGGSNIDKLQFITEYVLVKFEESLNRKSVIHDINLRKWALEAKDAVNLASFTASSWWIWKFKKVHNIVSRKITTFKTITKFIEEENIKHVAQAFVASVKPDIVSFGADEVYNADESGFNLEMHSGRTLTPVGTKTVESAIQSVSASTHSYTIMPIISASGKLISPLYIVLKESTGTFGPRVLENLFRPENIYVEASKSGKLTSEHFQTWFKEVYLPNTGQRNLLLLDSWTGHCPEQLQPLVPDSREVRVLRIPKKTTGIIQPLDVFGFRIWKNFVRTFSDAVILHGFNVNLHSRNEIIKLQSLTHNQLSSPRFQNLFKYSWYKSGYIETRPNTFDNPVDFCYFRNDKHVRKCSICGKPAFIRCAWCGHYFCFEHFYEQYHYCKHYTSDHELTPTAVSKTN